MGERKTGLDTEIRAAGGSGPTATTDINSTGVA